jgi:ribonuclease HI
MATKKNKKYYAVRNGRNPGIYESWEDCQKQVSGFPNNAYKSFSTLKEAEDYMSADSAEQQQITFDIPDVDTGLNIYVDGSFKDGQYTWLLLLTMVMSLYIR